MTHKHVSTVSMTIALVLTSVVILVTLIRSTDSASPPQSANPVVARYDIPAQTRIVPPLSHPQVMGYQTSQLEQAASTEQLTQLLKQQIPDCLEEGRSMPCGSPMEKSDPYLYESHP